MVSALMPSKVLTRVWNKFRTVIEESSHVVMMQANLTYDDVNFVTSLVNVDAHDRSKVKAYQFQKPIQLHPIEFSTDLTASMLKLVDTYGKSIDKVTKRSDHPFVVFCCSCNYALFLVQLLKARAKEVGGDPLAIRGIWGDCRDEPWNKNFCNNPAMFGTEADVLVATSVIGAGFSIETHF